MHTGEVTVGSELFEVGLFEVVDVRLIYMYSSILYKLISGLQ